MAELTGKQRRFLRSMGQKLSPTAAVGKAGLTDAAVANVSAMLDRCELIKVRLPAGPQRKDAAAALAEATGALCAGVVGRTALLYRPNEQTPLDRRIRLP
jgi:RNA-binding protein